MTPLRRVLLLPLALVLPAACGMKSEPAMSPTHANQASYAQQPGQGYPQAAAAPHAEPPPPAATQAPSSVGGLPPAGASVGQMPRHGESPDRALESPADLPSALRVLDDEAKALSGVMPLCATACRSLGSMERAARVVCELTREGEPARCDQARQKLREARERVRKGCGACEGGPRTDPDAPGP